MVSFGNNTYELVICGSPRSIGVSNEYSTALAAQFESQGKQVRRWNVADHAVSGCIGCEACRGDAHECAQSDDMGELYELLDGSSALHVVSPVYFSGPPSQFKAVLDRLQPYWECRRGPNAVPGAAQAPKRPAELHVIGQGGDPFGFSSLETCVRSALGAAGWNVLAVHNHIGWEQQKERF